MKYEISIYSNAKSESVETVVEILNDEALRELLYLLQNPSTDFAKCEKLYDIVELALKEAGKIRIEGKEYNSHFEELEYLDKL